MKTLFRCSSLATVFATVLMSAGLAHAAAPTHLSLACRPEKAHYAAGAAVTFMATLWTLPGHTALPGKCVQFVRVAADGRPQLVCRAYTDAAGRALCPGAAPGAGQRLQMQAVWVGDEQAAPSRSAVVVVVSE